MLLWERKKLPLFRNKWFCMCVCKLSHYFSKIVCSTISILLENKTSILIWNWPLLLIISHHFVGRVNCVLWLEILQNLCIWYAISYFLLVLHPQTGMMLPIFFIHIRFSCLYNSICVSFLIAYHRWVCIWQLVQKCAVWFGLAPESARAMFKSPIPSSIRSMKIVIIYRFDYMITFSTGFGDFLV